MTESSMSNIFINADTVSEAKVNSNQLVSMSKKEIPQTSAPTVSSFIRLFILHRIISNCDDHEMNESVLKKLTITLQNEKLQEKVFEILFRLLNGGIQKYMSKWYNKKEQADMIELIFDKIISNKFEKEYHKVTTYVSKNDNHFQSFVFNSSDLMCLIFQFLEFDLFNCSLVNSHWLYHCWNPNSVYSADLTQLMYFTMDYKHMVKYNLEAFLCMWHRLIHAKMISINNCSLHNGCNLQQIFEKLSLLRNVTKINGVLTLLTKDALLTIHKILSKWQNGITKYSMKCILNAEVNDSIDSRLFLILLNAHWIKIEDKVFGIIWSNKCEYLEINIADIKEKWFEHVINNCDCTGIKSLNVKKLSCLFEAGIDCIKNSNSKSKSNVTKVIAMTKGYVLLSKFVNKFENLKRLKLHFGYECDSGMILLGALFKPIIDKNNVEVILTIDDNINILEEWPLIPGVDSIGGKINKLFIHLESETWLLKTFKDIPPRCSQHLQWLEMTYDLYMELLDEQKIQLGDVGLAQFINYYAFGQFGDVEIAAVLNHKQKIAYPVLDGIKIVNAEFQLSIKHLNQCLEIALNCCTRRNRPLFIGGTFCVWVDYKHPTGQMEKQTDKNDAVCVGEGLAQFRQNVAQFIVKRIPFNLNVTMAIEADTTDEIIQEALDQFNTILDIDNLSKQYKEPRCNDACIGLKCLHFSFERVQNTCSMVFEAKNAKQKVCLI